MLILHFRYRRIVHIQGELYSKMLHCICFANHVYLCTRFVKFVTLICQRCYTDLSKLLHAFVKMLHVFPVLCQTKPNWSWPRFERFCFVEDTNLATCGFGMDISFLCGNSQPVFSSQILAGLWFYRFYFRWSCITVAITKEVVVHSHLNYYIYTI